MRSTALPIFRKSEMVEDDMLVGQLQIELEGGEAQVGGEGGKAAEGAKPLKPEGA
jgi:hypothetical protein